MKIKYSLIFLLIVILIVILYSIPSKEEYKAMQDIKYKDGPLIINRNDVGCIKYEYYDSVFWKCKDKSINYVTEETCSFSPLTKRNECKSKEIKVIK